MEAAYHQGMTYLAAKSAEETINTALRWVSEAPPSNLPHTVALLRTAVNHLERIVEWAESMDGSGNRLEQQNRWHQILLVVRSIQERLTHRQQDMCGTALPGTDIHLLYAY